MWRAVEIVVGWTGLLFMSLLFFGIWFWLPLGLVCLLPLACAVMNSESARITRITDSLKR